MKSGWEYLRASPIFPSILFFLVCNVVFEQVGGVNPDSRYMALAALAEEGTPRIDRYMKNTVDWARTPDGHFYSNKAPGPILLAYPLYKPIDLFMTAWQSDRESRDYTREFLRFQILRLLAILLQVIPFAFLAAWVANWLRGLGISIQALNWSMAALLFGNTAAVMMNTYFGHPMAAGFLVASLLFALNGRFFWTGMCAGWALLSDYGAMWLIPPLAVYLIASPERRAKAAVWRSVGGGVLPAILWVAYHTYCFGGPFSLPNRFQNPVFVDSAHEAINLWGVLGLPKGSIALQLLVGPERGILWTQPWFLLTLLVLPWVLGAMSESPVRRALASLSKLLIPTFLGLFLMNAGFGGWHGGSTMGPRYLSIVFPAFATLVALMWDSVPVWVQRLWQVSIGASVLFWAFTLITVDILLDFVPLWPHYLSTLVFKHKSTYFVRAMLLMGILFFVWGRSRPPKSKLLR